MKRAVSAPFGITHATVELECEAWKRTSATSTTRSGWSSSLSGHHGSSAMTGGVTQRWARQIYETGQFDGVSWWSRRDARWTSIGLWNHAAVSVQDVTVLIDLDGPPIAEAAGALLRPFSPRR